ncbi:MAG: hypothetical protein ACT4TC_09110, partial [Myxococcaceae bacterium]
LPSLIWHDRLGTQLAAGACLMLLFAELSTMGYLLDLGDDWMKLSGSPPTRKSLFWYLTGPCGLLLLTSLGRVLAGLRGDSPLPHGGAPVLLAEVLTFGVVASLWRAHEKYPALRESVLRVLDPLSQALHRLWAGTRQTMNRELLAPLHAIQSVLVLLVACAYALTNLFWFWVPAILVVALLIAAGNMIWGFFAFFFGPWRSLLTLATVLLFFFIVPTLSDSKVPHLPAGPFALTAPRRAEAPERAAAALLDDNAVLEAWLERNVSTTHSGPLIVVVTSGGGVRAATWTAQVLETLQGAPAGLSDFADHVRLVTGASGGMLGASAFVASLDVGPETAKLPVDSRLPAAVSRDSLTPLARELLLVAGDRSRALELGWEEATGVLGKSFADLRVHEGKARLPSLALAPMMLEDGRRLLISNLDLYRLATSSLTPGEVLSYSGVQLFQVVPGSEALHLSTAVRLNATFPWVTTAAQLPTLPPRRAVDAGYYDNYGVNLGALWLLRHASRLRDVPGIALVQIRDERLGAQRQDVTKPDRSSYWGARLSPLLTPITGLLSAREASMAYRNDEYIDAVSETLNPADVPRRFEMFVFELEEDAPLSWALSERERKKILAGMGSAQNQRELQRLQSWWRARHTPTL